MADKKALINLKNNEQQCLKWAVTSEHPRGKPQKDLPKVQISKEDDLWILRSEGLGEGYALSQLQATANSRRQDKLHR